MRIYTYCNEKLYLDKSLNTQQISFSLTDVQIIRKMTEARTEDFIENLIKNMEIQNSRKSLEILLPC